MSTSFIGTQESSEQQLHPCSLADTDSSKGSNSHSSSSKGVWSGDQDSMQIDRYVISSEANQLSPEQTQQAEQHLLRFIVCEDLPFEVVDCPHFAEFYQLLCPGYSPPCSTVIRTNLLVAEYSSCLQQLYKRLQAATNLTVSADISTRRNHQSCLEITAVLPDGSAGMLGAVHLPAEECTAEGIAQHIVQVLQRWEITARVALLVTDGDVAVAEAGRIVVDTPGLQHVIPFRCCTHAFVSLLASAMSHSWAASSLSKAQQLAAHFQASEQLLALLQQAQARLPGTTQPALASANTADLTSAAHVASSVLRNRAAFASLLSEPGGREAVGDAGVLQLLQDEQFFADLVLLDALLQPISWALAEVQHKGATLADAARNNIPLLQLALFLEPSSRLAALQQQAIPPAGSSNSSSSSSSSSVCPALSRLQLEAGTLAQRLGWSENKVLSLFQAMAAYACNQEPFSSQQALPCLYWRDVAAAAQQYGSSAGAEGEASSGCSATGVQLLADMAQRLLGARITAATQEQVSRRIGCSNSSRQAKCARLDAAEAAAAGDSIDEEEEAVSGVELAGELRKLHGVLRPPADVQRSWADAVADAFGGWDVSSSLRLLSSSSYREGQQAAVMKGPTAATGQLSG
uniref:DUF659 domain-containing protein n=1 Tax=Tetradesmus obliquus TaxID=3088 RepID=A0A383VUA2_TETOB